MSRPVGTVTIAWRNGEDDFCVSRIKDALLLEEKCGCGVYQIAERLSSVLANAQNGTLGGRAYVNDIRETIRIGLIGGGKKPEEAAKIVASCVDGYPLAHSVLVAHRVLTAYLVGVPGDPLGKTQAGEAATGQESLQTTAASSAPESTASAAP